MCFNECGASLWFGGVLLLLVKSKVKRLLISYKSECVLFWLIGMLFGFLAGYNTPDSVVSLVRASLPGSVSIVWVLVLVCFPYLIYYLLQRVSLKGLIPYLILGKAYCYIFSICVISRAFGDAGWLVCALCFCADSVSVFVLLHFLLGCFTSNRKWHNIIFSVSIVVTVLFVFINHFAVLPFWLSVI